MTKRFTPSDPQLLRDPYPTYARYREEDAVHWGIASMATLPGSWYLFRYAENAEMLSDSETFVSDAATVGMEIELPEAFAPIRHIHQRWLGGIDPPDHRRLRTIMARSFTPRRIQELSQRIWDITSTLVDDALADSSGTVDLWRQVAFPMPMNVIGDALGVLPEDWTVFQKWAQDISDGVDRAGDAEAGKRGAQAILGMYAYFEELIERRRKQPVDDLFNAMITAADDDGNPMTQFDAIAIATELGVAGHETTTNGISLAMVGLLTQDGGWARAQEALRLNADPVLAKRLQDIGTATVMPLGSPIGSNRGIETRAQIMIIIEQATVPVVVDAGLGAPSHATEAMEMGADAVLVNTAIAIASDPVRMAKAFKKAIEAGREAREIGIAAKLDVAAATSPLTGFLNEPQRY